MRLQKLCVLALVIIAVAAVETARADYLPGNVVNVDFNGQQPGDVLGPTYSGSLVPGSGTTWNGITVASGAGLYDQTVTGTHLLNSAGGETSIGINLVNVGGDNASAGANPATLPAIIGDYVFCWTGSDLVSSTITISGLGSATTADLAFYISSADALDGIAFTGAPRSSAGTVVDLGNGAGYMLPFYGVPVSDGTITGVLTDPAIGSQIAIMAGMSIATAVPEPGAMAMVASAMLGLLCYAWRTRK
jgi:hypothetical protein